MNRLFCLQIQRNRAIMSGSILEYMKEREHGKR